jgi:nucleotide-binding universal stress UspA family protein
MEAEKLLHWTDPRLILAATNLADEGVLAYQAASEGRENGAKILLVHVLRPSSSQSRLNPPANTPITTSRQAAAWHVLDRMAKMIDWQGAACEPMLLEGDPAEEITKVVRERAIDRVVVATRSARGLDRLIAGSVAEALMETLEAPVCVIGPRVATNPFRGMRAGHVLLALSLNHDRGDCAERRDCVEFALALAEKRRAALTVMHVLDAGDMDEGEKRSAVNTARSSIAMLLNKIPGTPIQPEIAVRDGPAAHAILEEDACAGTDFVIMGAPSLGTLSKLLGTNVVHAVIAGSPCPVITLRAAAHPTARDAGKRFQDREEVITLATYPAASCKQTAISRKARVRVQPGCDAEHWLGGGESGNNTLRLSKLPDSAVSISGLANGDSACGHQRRTGPTSTWTKFDRG